MCTARRLVHHLGILYEFLGIATHPSVLRWLWIAPAEWDFVTALLTVPRLAILVPTERDAHAAPEIFLGIPHVAGNLLRDLHTGASGAAMICTL